MANYDMTQVDVAGAYATQATGINDWGKIVAIYGVEMNGGAGQYVFLDNNGTFTTIAIPGASSAAGVESVGINDLGQIAGTYFDVNFDSHSFLDTNGTFTTIADPNSSNTVVGGINNLGQIVGTYQDAAGTHLFVDT